MFYFCAGEFLYRMFAIGDVIIEDTVAVTRFCCDLSRCKGACCTIEGGRGAPLLDAEIPEIQTILPAVRQYLRPEYLRLIDAEGPYEGKAGDYATSCYEQRACVFVMEKDGIAGCAIEHAFLRGEVGWRKPLSCHLFPIRIRKFGGDILHIEMFSECKPAYRKGAREGVMAYDFLREPLIRAYGEEWYKEFRAACEDLIDQGLE